MKCHKCGKTMEYSKGLRFNKSGIDGWRCRCGEIYFDSEQAQRILLLNKLEKDAVRVKLGRIRSNLILRLPRRVEEALCLKKGEEVTVRIKDNCLVVEI